MRSVDFNLYLITDRKLLPESCSLVEAVASAIRGGVKAVQLREKDLDGGILFDIACSIVHPGIQLMINDRLDVARAVTLETQFSVGVHLTGQSVKPKWARQFLGDEALIGVSTHSLAQALEAQREGADFVTFGPVFETPSKKIFGPPVGLDALGLVCSTLSIPVFALGGITLERIQALQSVGAKHIALISAIFGTGHRDAIQAAATAFCSAIDS